MAKHNPSSLAPSLYTREAFPRRQELCHGKTAFEQRSKHRQNGHKNPATSIVVTFADMGDGYVEILISMWDGSIIQLDKLEFGGESPLTMRHELRRSNDISSRLVASFRSAYGIR